MEILFFFGFCIFCLLWMGWFGPALSEAVLLKYGSEAVHKFCLWEGRIGWAIIAIVTLFGLFITFDGFVCTLTYARPGICEYLYGH